VSVPGVSVPGVGGRRLGSQGAAQGKQKP